MDEQELARTRDFFGPRAAGWEARFRGDGPAYQAAVDALGLAPGGRALDAGCGTGRALPMLRAAVGRAGTVVGVDLTPEMLATAAGYGRLADAALVMADAARLPLGEGTVDAVLAAGLLPHLAHPGAALRELARVTRPGGRLALFHPVGRAVLAARHGREVRDDDLLSVPTLVPLLLATGWAPEAVDDGAERYLATATRAG